MGGFLLSIRNWWQNADRTQKLIAISGSAIFCALVFGTYLFASKPKMSLVFNNLDPLDTGTVAMEVEGMGIPCEYDTNGNVSVPSDQVAKVKALLAMKGKLPKSGKSNANQFSGISPLSSDAITKEQMKAILEGELSEAIQLFDGVDSANIQISPAVDSPFDSDKKPAQANVTISEKAGATVSTDEAKAMANLVASSVTGLETNKVTIFTRTGRSLWDGQDLDSPGAIASNRFEMEKAEARKRRDDLQEALNKMLGPGNAIAMVDLTLNMDKVDEVTDDHQGKMVPAKEIKETLNGKNSGTQPGSGTGSNGIDAATGASSSSTNGYEVVQKANDPSMWPGTSHKTIKHSVGEVKTMGITVLVNQPTGKTVVDPKNADDPIVKLANAALPPHDANDAIAKTSFTANVVAYPFDTTQADAAKKAEAASTSSNRMQQILSILPIAALLLVAFFVIRAIGKLANRPFTPALAGAGGPSLPMTGGSSHLFPSALQSGAARATDDANRFVLPEIVKQKALEAGISEEQLQAAIEEAGEAGISLDDIPSIKNKINVPLEQIKKMASERPETVAMMIKSWLIEEGIRR